LIAPLKPEGTAIFAFEKVPKSMARDADAFLIVPHQHAKNFHDSTTRWMISQQLRGRRRGRTCGGVRRWHWQGRIASLLSTVQ
jgi:hypothetical protein